MTNDSSPPFIHLRVKSAYSLAEGAIRVKDLVKLSAGLDMPAVALTDRGNLFGALEFAVTRVQSRPATGYRGGFWAFCAARTSADPPLPIPTTCCCWRKIKPVTKNLMSLISEGYLLADGGDPAVAFDALTGRTEGLIALDGAGGSPLSRHLLDGSSMVETHLAAMKSLFDGRLYLELQRHGQSFERVLEPRVLKLATAHNLPIVATNDAHFFDGVISSTRTTFCPASPKALRCHIATASA